ncbi:MAG TPA: M20 family metallopeptidase [Tepidisphaeraceae bacterium]|nr:M20 family metallopeptidase [Tepidisphaeraceae bacterium]
MDVHGYVSGQLASVISLRRKLHQIPELGYEEFKTAAFIRAELDRLRIEHIDGVHDAPTATIAWLGDTNKPCIALRSDIDALPIVENTKLAYASIHDGRMHACGHDGHISILLGTAAILKSITDQLPVCVKLIFQPAEEGGAGADRLCKAGVLDGRIGPKVSAIFGLHGWPGLPLGLVSTKPGALLAATDTFSVTFVGRGCHAAFPHMGRDPVITACEAVLNLQQFVSRDIDPTEPAVITVAMLNAGTTTNVIPDRATIAGTARTLSESARKLIEESMRRRCAGIAAANGCQAEFTWEPGYPPTINDPGMTEYVAKITRSALGPDRFFPAARPAMGGEDFAYYLQQVPGCFFLIGVCPPDRNQYPSLHSDQFDFTDAAMGIGMRTFVELVRNFPA